MSQGSMNFDSDMQQSLTSSFHTKKNNTNKQKSPQHLRHHPILRASPPWIPIHTICLTLQRLHPHASQISLPTLPLSVLVVVRVCGSRSRLHSGQFCCRFGIRIRNGPTSGPRIYQNKGRLFL